MMPLGKTITQSLRCIQLVLIRMCWPDGTSGKTSASEAWDSNLPHVANDSPQQQP